MAQKHLESLACLRMGFRTIRIGVSLDLQAAGPLKRPLTEPPIRKPEQNRQEPWGQGRPVERTELMTSGQLRIAVFLQPRRPETGHTARIEKMATI